MSQKSRFALKYLLPLCLVGGSAAYLLLPNAASDAPRDPVNTAAPKQQTSLADTPGANGSGEADANSASVQEVTTPTTPGELTTEQIQQTVQGNWQSEYYGTRYLNIRPDGTATIYFEASMMASMVVGQRLRLEYEWAYEPQAGQVVFTAVKGSPQKSYEYVLKMWGKNMRQNVLTVCQSELQLQDLDGKTTHVWKQLSEIPETIKSRFEKL